MMKQHPKGLYVLFFTEMWERFGFYTVMAIFVLYLSENFHWSNAVIGNVYGIFLAGVYFTPLLGGWIADNIFGYSKTIVMGAMILSFGYGLMAIPNTLPWFLYLALAVVILGNGLFKANISVLVGNLYSQKEGSLKDAGFNIFYMGINIGAFFAPYAANGIKRFVMTYFNATLAEGYNAGFGLASAGMIISMIIFITFRKHYLNTDYRSKETGPKHEGEMLTRKQIEKRMIALVIILTIVSIFWMVYYQNGFTLTLFAKNYTYQEVGKGTFLLFDPVSLCSLLALTLGLIGLLRKNTGKKIKALSLGAAVIASALIAYKVLTLPNINLIAPELFQVFNPLFIIFLTPLIVGGFGWLNEKGLEPSTPGKITIAMLFMAAACVILIIGSYGMAKINTGGYTNSERVTPYWLISAYFVITVAELFLSPMGLSFISKVSPARYKGLMYGFWFVASAVGSYLAGAIGILYQRWQIWEFFLLLSIISLFAAGLMGLFLKRLRLLTAKDS